MKAKYNYHATMSIEQVLESQLKRLHYWSKDGQYKPPRRKIKRPNDMTIEDITKFNIGDTIKIEMHD